MPKKEIIITMDLQTVATAALYNYYVYARLLHALIWLLQVPNNFHR